MLARAGSLLALVACTGTNKPAPTDGRDRGLARLLAARDEREMLPVLSHDVEYHGVSFTDPSCHFEEGLVTERALFARCIAGLHLVASDRPKVFDDLVLVTHGPGIELATKFNTSGKLTWIGFTTLSHPHTVTISQHALEALRIAGETTAATKEQAWIEVCIDTTGATDHIRPRATTSFDSYPEFRRIAETWKHLPFTLAGTATSVCSLVHVGATVTRAMPIDLGYAAPWTGVLPEAIEHRRVAGSLAIEPDRFTRQVLEQEGIDSLHSTVFVCVDTSGKVVSTQLRTPSMADYDTHVQAVIRGWRYEPLVLDDHFVSVCMLVPFVYSSH